MCTRCTINRSVAANCFCTIAWLPLTPQLVGQGERARAAQEAMDALVDRAAERERERDPKRTFAAGLDWFCRHVKAKAVAERYAAGVSGAEDWVQQLTDVASVCDQWLESLARV